MKEILHIEGLKVSFTTYGGAVQAVRGINISLQEGEILGIVGESGSGKSVTVQAMMGLCPPQITTLNADTYTLLGKDVGLLKEEAWRRLRGTEVAMIFQDPMTALNPIVTIGKQVEEVVTLRRRRKPETVSGMTEAQEVVHLLRQVGISEPERRVKQYPHELSGGMRQRVVIAMALAGKPKLLLADEPTTALDVTTEAQILGLLKKLVAEEGLGMIIISHNLRVIARLCDKVAVMYAGKIMEYGSIEEILNTPAHPYLQGLLASLPESARGNTLTAIEGQPPDGWHIPAGCPFHPRCAKALRICAKIEPSSVAVTKSSDTHRVYCWLYHTEVK